MAGPNSPVPVRTPAGATTDPPYGPLADCGMGNPFFYHQFYDDFDAYFNTGATGIWTQTKSGNGTFTHAAADGGVGQMTTNSSTPVATDFNQIQLPNTSYILTASKKTFFLVRLGLTSATNAAFRVGLLGMTTPANGPWAASNIQDGIYFDKASGALNNLNLITAVGGTLTTFAIPTSAYTLANSAIASGALTNTIDLGFYVDRNQNLKAFVGSQLVGYMPQSGTGAVNSAGVSVLPSLGAVLAAAISGNVVDPRANIWAPTTALLNLTVAVESGTAASSSMYVDFATAMKER